VIEARTADGTILRFPDGTPDAAVDRGVADYLHEQGTKAAAHAANSGFGGYLDSIGRALASGATLNFADELAAGGDALLGHLAGRGSQAPDIGTRYSENLAAERARDKDFSTNNPVASGAANVVGGVAATIAAAPVARALAGSRAVAPIISTGNRLLAPLPEWGADIARYATGGAILGGGGGFGEGEGGVSNRLTSAGTGAATGAVVGAVLPPAVTAATGVTGRVTHALGLRDPTVAADRQIVRALDRGGVSLDEAGTRLAEAGDAPVSLVDVGGRNVVNLGATAANTPSTAMDVADRFVEMRRLGRPDRLQTAGDAAFGGGSGTDIAEITHARQAQRTAEASPLYQDALSKPAGFTDAMAGVLKDPITKAGMARGLEIQRIENTTRVARGEPAVPTTDPAIRYDEDGTPRIVGVPNMRSLDAVKRGLDAIIEDARDPTSGRVQWTERLRAIDDLRRTWVGMLDENNPAYAAARAAWGGPTAQMEATQAGRTALRTDRDVVAQRMDPSRPPDVRDAYRLGAGRDFADRVSDPARASGSARLLLEDGQMQQRLASILPPDAHAALNDALRREVQMTAVERSVSPRAGSQTARLVAGGDDMGHDVAGPVATAVRQLLSGHPMAAVGTAGAEAWRRVGQGIVPATADALSGRLFVTDPALRLEAVQALRNRLMLDDESTARARRIVAPLVRGAAASAGGSRASRD
jgi:hypothetical protein